MNKNNNHEDNERIFDAFGEELEVEVCTMESDRAPLHAVIHVGIHYLSPSSAALLIQKLEQMIKKAGEMNYDILTKGINPITNVPIRPLIEQ